MIGVEMNISISDAGKIPSICSLHYFYSRYLISNLTGYPAPVIAFSAGGACN